MENNQRYTTWEIADILKISRSIKLLVKMKNVSFILWKKTKQTFWLTQCMHKNSFIAFTNDNEYNF